MTIAGPDDSAVRGRGEESFGAFEVIVQLSVELLQELVADSEERGGRVDHHHQEQDNRVPAGQANANRRSRPPEHHGSPSRSTKPTPRKVWMSRGPLSGSTYLRRRVICTSMTLSSGVTRRGSLHTSRASISRDTRCPWCRSRYSKSSNSRAVRSSSASPRVTRRVTRSSSKSAAFRRSTSDGRPRRKSARIRASN